MKTLKESILSSTNTGKASFIPKTKEELQLMIKKEIKKKGNNCNLNHIKTHKITDMSSLFDDSELYYFNGDISKWDVSKVEDMSYMFFNSQFNSDISKWDVSNVETMEWMFESSEFNQNISSWKIKSNCETCGIFDDCPIEEKYKPLKNGKRIK
jgi:surface protein